MTATLPPPTESASGTLTTPSADIDLDAPTRIINARSLHQRVGPEAIGIPLIGLDSTVQAYAVHAQFGPYLMTVNDWHAYLHHCNCAR
jgi:hypothetical protein